MSAIASPYVSKFTKNRRCPMVGGGSHIHAHLTLFIDGVEAWAPAGMRVLRPVILDPAQPNPSIVAGSSFY